MERMRKAEKSRWITPGVFSGGFELAEAVGQLEYVKKQTHEDLTRTQLEELSAQVNDCKRRLEVLRKDIQEQIAHLSREREYLYHVVMSLKREWEAKKSSVPINDTDQT